MAGRGSIAALFAPLLRRGAAFETRAIEGDAPPLLGAEVAAMANVAPRRLRTFAFGRACARAALGEDIAIPVGQGGQPTWPAGVIGSITHTDDHAAAVVMTAGRSIGIDLESRAHAARTPDLLEMVALPSERGLDAALVFSAKEAVYKCLYPITGTFLEFHDVELALEESSLVARAAGHVIQVRFAVDDEHVATVAIV